MNDANAVPRIVFTFDVNGIPFISSKRWTPEDDSTYRHFATVLENPMTSDPHFRLVLTTNRWEITPLTLPNVSASERMTELVFTFDDRDTTYHTHSFIMNTSDAVDMWRKIVAFAGADKRTPHVKVDLRDASVAVTAIGMDESYDWGDDG